MGSLNASFTLHLCLPWQHLLRHGVEGSALARILVLRKFNMHYAMRIQNQQRWQVARVFEISGVQDNSSIPPKV